MGDTVITQNAVRPRTLPNDALNAGRLSTYQKVQLTRNQLELEWQRFKPLARQLADNYDPHRWYEFYEDLDAQEAANAKILNETPGIAADTMVSGLCAGMAPSTQEWFEFTVNNPVVEQIWEVKQWLYDTQKDIELIIQQSNFYPSFPLCMRDFVLSTGGCFMILPDPAQVFRMVPFRPGQYRIGLDKNGYPTVFSATMRMTLRQMVEMFGDRDPDNDELIIENFSDRAVNAMKSNLWDQWFDIVLSINPNEDMDPNSLAAKKRYGWRVRYWELGNPPLEEPERWLMDTAMDYFPVVFFPYETNGKDAYAVNCPGKRALPAVKELYFLEQQYTLALDLKTDPPIAKHPDIKEVDSLPGGEIDLPENAVGDKAIQTLFKVDLDMQHLAARIDSKENKINTIFFVDFFRMLVDREGKEPLTATEVMEKKKEIMTLLTTAYGQGTKYGLEPAVNIIYHLAQKQGRLRPAPAIMGKMKLDVKFQSIIAKALAMTDLSSLQAALDFLEKFMAVNPNAAFLLDEYETFKNFMGILSLPPHLMPSKEDYARIKQQAAQAKQAETQAQVLPAAATAAQKLSQADPSQGLLGHLMELNRSGNAPGAAA